MRLFSYVAGDFAAPGRLAGSLGVDINLAVKHFSSSHSVKNEYPDEVSNSMVDWLSMGEDGYRLIQTSTDWILETYPMNNESYRKNGVVFDLDLKTLLAPIPNPGKVICVAGNFPAPGAMNKPEYPVIFLKPSSGVTGHNHPVRIPANAHNVAYEVELAVVIGRRCRQVSPEDALDNVAGYTLANDLGDRVLEKRTTQWASGKMFDTFTPLGPVMVTRDELNPFDTLEMSTHLNGDLVQHGFITGMFFNVPDLVSIISELTTLYPGDVLLCGSPKMIDDKPNPSIAIKPGDLIEVSIEKLGTLSNQAISEEFLEK